MASVIIIGAGLMGRWHAHACLRTGAPVAAFVDRDLDAAERLAGRFGGAAFRDLSEALEQHEAPFVHVCSPVETHEPLVRVALRRGRHVLAEKPLTADAAGAERLMVEAEQRRLLLVPVHQFLFQPGVRRIIATQGAWGPLRHLHAVACSAGAEGMGTHVRRSVARDILPHFLSILERLRPGALDRAVWTAREPTPGELNVASAHDGMVAAVTISMSGRPTRNTLEVIGERGSAHADLFHGYAAFESPAVSRSRKILRPFDTSARRVARAGANLASRAVRREPAYPGLRELVAAFHKAGRSGGPAPITPAETLAVARARDRIVALLEDASAATTG